MISVLLQGRLGNQLFQYAFIHSTARKLGTHFLLNHTLEQAVIYKYFELSKGVPSLISKIFNTKGFKNLFSYHLRVNFSKIQSSLIPGKKLEYAFDVTPTEILGHLKNDTLYCGYFQSEVYFKDYEAEIRSAFALKKSITKKYDETYKALFKDKKTIAIHIRKSDYQFQGHLNLGKDDISLPISYYHQLIPKLDDEKTLFIFTSDEPQLIEKEFGYVKNKHISFSDEITDFQHLLNADICVISNSTFSWWAAYLNQKINKIIYCPKYFLGFHLKKTMPPEIYPANWLQIEIEE